jgi:hypothetical protein
LLPDGCGGCDQPAVIWFDGHWLCQKHHNYHHACLYRGAPRDEDYKTPAFPEIKGWPEGVPDDWEDDRMFSVDGKKVDTSATEER